MSQCREKKKKRKIIPLGGSLGRAVDPVAAAAATVTSKGERITKKKKNQRALFTDEKSKMLCIRWRTCVH
jgi:hypothetical protein